MSEISSIIKKIVEFRDRRDWKRFHTPKDLAMDLVIEASELLEIFLWKKEKELKRVVKEKKEKIKEELADVFITAFLIAHDLKLDVSKLIKKKLKINEEKYPIEKCKGKNKKYDEL